MRPAEPLPSPANPVLPLPAPISTQDVYAEILTAPEGTLNAGKAVVVYTADEHEKLTDNIAEIYRWVAEAMAQLEFYRRREED